MRNVICGRCVKCGREYEARPDLTNCACGGILDIVYDYDYEVQESFKFGGNYGRSQADAGYMYGERIVYHSVQAGTTTFTFSNDVSRSGDTYTLDTSTGQSIKGTWADERLNAAKRYHYFCTNGHAVQMPGLGTFGMQFNTKVAKTKEEATDECISRKYIRFWSKHEIRDLCSQKNVRIEVKDLLGLNHE